MTSRECRKCTIVQPIENFGRYVDPRNGRERRRRTCNKCRVARETERYMESADLRIKMKGNARISHLKNQYGITPEQFEMLATIQRHLCAICELEKPLCVDHCHNTRRVRGLLCKSCNFGLGSFHDNPRYLSTAITYLGAALNSKDFCYWLQGFFELTDKPDALTQQQTEAIRRHLALVFKHEIDPSAGGPENQAVLNKIHGGDLIRC